jgi:rubrerythrin
MVVAQVIPTEDGRAPEVAAAPSRRREYRCMTCGYGVVVRAEPPQCPMCHEHVWLPAGELAW